MSDSFFRNTNSHFVINKKLLRELGPDKTFLLQLLINAEPKWTPKQAIETDGWFFFSSEELKESLCFTDETKTAIEQKMIDDSLIETRPIRGSSDLCYRINWDTVEAILRRA